MISDKLKKIVFDELYRELGKAEIINYNGNVWFIDRQKKYWYFELQKDGRLWWRYSFFNDFFLLFSLDSARFEPILKDWVEEVLNCKVNTTAVGAITIYNRVEEVLNCKVNTTVRVVFFMNEEVEEVLNCKVNTTDGGVYYAPELVEEVLNCKVDKTASSLDKWMGEILKCTPGTANDHLHQFKSEVEDILNHTVTNMDGGEMIDEESYVDKVLNHTIK